MKLLIPKQDKPVKVRFDVKLEESLLEKLDLYCQFKESDRDWVIGAVLAVLFKKDKDFAEWRRAVDDPSPAKTATVKERVS